MDIKETGWEAVAQDMLSGCFCENGNELCGFRFRGLFSWLKYN